MRKIFLSIIFPILMLILWELISRYQVILINIYSFFGVENSKIPDFSFIISLQLIFDRMYHIVADGIIVPYLFDTIWRSLFAFIISTFVGVLLGFFLGLKKNAELILYPSVDAIRSIPPIALLPLFILFFGVDDFLKVTFILFGAIWPIVISTHYSVKNIEPMYFKVAHNLNLSKKDTFLKIILPSSLPGIFTGMKISISLSLILAIVSEMLTGNTGLGWFINYSKRNFDFGDMYASIIILALLGWGINKLFLSIDKYYLKWYHESQTLSI